MASGEGLYACYNHAGYVALLAASGEPLPRVIEEADRRLEFVGGRVIIARFHCVLERQLARALAGHAEAESEEADDGTGGGGDRKCGAEPDPRTYAEVNVEAGRRVGA